MVFFLLLLLFFSHGESVMKMNDPKLDVYLGILYPYLKDLYSSPMCLTTQPKPTLNKSANLTYD